MLELEDYRKSRFYQEAEKAEIIKRMASKDLDAKQIAGLVGIDIKIVKKILKSKSS